MRRRRGPGVAERKMAVPRRGSAPVGGSGPDGRVGTKALTPFCRRRGPLPGRARPSGSGSFHSRRRGARRAAPAKSGSSRGEGTQARITILIASRPFLEGEGLEAPSPRSTKMFNHRVESNQIL